MVVRVKCHEYKLDMLVESKGMRTGREYSIIHLFYKYNFTLKSPLTRSSSYIIAPLDVVSPKSLSSLDDELELSTHRGLVNVVPVRVRCEAALWAETNPAQEVRT